VSRLNLPSIIAVAGFALAAFGARAADVRLPDYTTATLDNGATVLLMPKKDVPLVSASVLVRGGALADAPGKEGTASLLADLLDKGAGDRDARAFAEAVDNAGGSLDFGSSAEALTASAQFLSKDTALMLSLLGDALLRPKLDAAEFDKVRKRAIDGLIAAKDADPSQLLDTYAAAWLFRGHPYGRPEGGDETSLAAISLDDLKSFHAQQMGGDRLIVAIVGDIDPAQTLALVQRTFGGWAKAPAAPPQVAAKPRESGRRVLLVDKPGATQTYFWLGNVGVAHGDPRQAAQDLMNTAFGGRFTSMLNTELRIKSGLSYGASSGLQRMRAPGAAEIDSFTKTDSTKQAIDLAIATLDRLHAAPLSADTIAADKRYVGGQYAPRLETAAQLAPRLSALALYGDGRDYIDGYLGRIAAATPEQVNAARDAFPSSRDLVVVAIGDAAKIRGTLQAYGPVTEMKIGDPRFAPAP
jgi:predicted Zn-dependent peptidase